MFFVGVVFLFFCFCFFDAFLCCLFSLEKLGKTLDPPLSLDLPQTRTGGEAVGTKEYGNLGATRSEEDQRLAFCDGLQCREIIVEEETRIEADMAAALERQAKRRRTANCRAEVMVRKEAKVA